MNGFHFSERLDRYSVDFKPMLTASELEDMFRVHRRTIGRWIAAGKFPQPLVLGRSRRWRSEDIANVIKQIA